METTTNLESFDENRSIQVIREMIEVSQKKLKNDGILFILWGWVMFYICFTSFVFKITKISWEVQNIFGLAGIVLLILNIILSVYYIFKKRKKVQTYIGISLKYVWFSMIATLIITYLIQFNILHSIKFELQHALFMIIVAFATVTTGGILRHKLIITGGILFGIFALLSTYVPSEYQFLIEAIAWLIAFVIPGHILYAKRNS
ncbi:MAG: hypothetical protein ACM34J_12285 [Ignavibacteria bacterium]